MKHCSKCGLDKPLGDFNFNKSTRSGLQSRCKKCQLISNRESARKRPEIRRAARRRQYQKEVANGGRISKKSPRYQKFAHLRVERAIKRGELIRPIRCVACGSRGNKIHAHHDDYSRPLKVRWLCTWCHGELHAKGTLGTLATQSCKRER